MSDLIVTNANGDVFLNRFHVVEKLIVDIQEMTADDWSRFDHMEAKKYVSDLNAGQCSITTSWPSIVPEYFSIGRIVLRRSASYRRCIVLKSGEFVASEFAKMLRESVSCYKVWSGLVASGLDERRYVIAPVGQMLG